jgi:hypothetical protein
MGNPLMPVPGSQPYPVAYGSSSAVRQPQSNNGMPSSVKSPGGLVLNFFGSNFTGSNEGVGPQPADTFGPVPYTGGAPMPMTGMPPVSQQPAALPASQPVVSGTAPMNAVDMTDPSKLSPAEQLNALYGKYNDAQRQQDNALKAVTDAERARNDYMALGNTIRNMYQPASPAAGMQTPAIPNGLTPEQQAALQQAQQKTLMEQAKQLGLLNQAQQQASQNQPAQPTLNAGMANNPPLMPPYGQNTQPNPLLTGQPPLPGQTAQPTLTPQQAALAAQALRQSGLTPQDAAMGMPGAQPSAGQNMNPAAASNVAAAAAPQQSQRPQAAAVTEPASSANPSSTPAATPSNLTGASATTLNNLIFAPEELVQFKKLTPREQIDWITQRNLQTKADAIGEIAIQSGMPNGNKFPQETYDRLQAIAKLDTKDIKGPAGDDLRYFRKTALWTLGLLNGSQNANVPVNTLAGIKTIEAIARDPKETNDIRIAAAQALQAINRSNDPTMQKVLKRVESNEKALIKPWTWLRAGTPNDVKKIVDSARKGVPIQANQGSSQPVGSSASMPEAATTVAS